MNIYTGLLFLDGHIANDVLARQLTQLIDADPGIEPVGTDANGSTQARAPVSAAGCRPSLIARLLDLVALLGGRPMTAGHNTDVEQPLPMPAGCPRTEAAGTQSAYTRRTKRARPPRRQPACSYCA